MSIFDIINLEIFCDLDCRFPNLIVCSLSKESCKNAFDKGITAEQIIDFLDKNSHQSKKNANLKDEIE